MGCRPSHPPGIQPGRPIQPGHPGLLGPTPGPPRLPGRQARPEDGFRGDDANMITLYEHPLSPYAQKCKIAMREKGLAFETLLPAGMGPGGAPAEFVALSPRAEVPALVDGEARIFDSTIILEYLDDAYPEPPMRPASPVEPEGGGVLDEGHA